MSSAQALELPAVLGSLQDHCGFFGSIRKAAELLPTDDAGEFATRQDETAEAIAALRENERLGCVGVSEIDHILERVTVGAVPEAVEFAQLRDSISGLARFAGSLAAVTIAPNLAARSRRIDPLADLVTAIGKTLDESGGVRDRASAELAQIRRQLRSKRALLEQAFGRLIETLSASGVLREPLFTVRDGRYVLPLRRESQSQVAGVVHDISSSGATVYVEPLPTVALNNALRTLRLQERNEIHRVLSLLTARIAQRADVLMGNLTLAAELDLILARGKLALVQAASRPRLAEDLSFDLRSARHPLLGSDAVPINVRVGGAAGFGALVVTGSNAGGKTVALKTVGLLHLMAACGLQIPAAAGSTVAIFDAIFADIGDEQSIAQNLSTFSSHMRRLAVAVDRATARSLVLCDEIGAGTDPAEGSALAAAIIDTLLERGSLVMATTHFGDLKYHAIDNPRAETASVEFDLETLAPRYRLQIGVAGSSHAIDIAGRSGLPQSVCRRARAGLAPKHREIESILQKVRSQHAEADKVQQEASDQARLTSQIHTNVTLEIAQQRARFEDELARQRANSRRMLREMESLSRQMARASAGSDSSAAKKIADRARSSQREHDQLGFPEPAEPSANRPEPGPAVSINPGDRVELTAPGPAARVIAVRRGGRELEVAVGSLRRRIDRSAVRRVVPGNRGQAKRRVAPSAPASPIPYRGDLHGVFPDHVAVEVDRHLDRAVAGNRASAVLVHGLGSGVLRDAVRSHLRGHPLVKKFAMGPPTEGGDGVTVVELR